MRGEAWFLGLWVVKGSSSKDFLLRRKSKSLSFELIRDEAGEFTGVTNGHGSFPFIWVKIFLSGVGEEDEIGMGIDPKEKSFTIMGVGEGTTSSSLGFGMRGQ